MKAFMTACAVLASSANADPQMISNVVNLDQPIGQRAFIRPYNVLPFNHISYTNSFGYTNTLPLTTYGRPSVHTYRVATIPANHFFKREAELESPYDIKTKVDNPVDGSKHEVQIQVDRSGKGQSFQRVEQNDQHNMRNDYIMDHRSMAQRPLMSKMYLAAHRGMDMNRQMERNQMGMNQMGMDRHQMGVARNQAEMYTAAEFQRLEEIANQMLREDSEKQILAKVKELWQKLASNGQARQMVNHQSPHGQLVNQRMAMNPMQGNQVYDKQEVYTNQANQGNLGRERAHADNLRNTLTKLTGELRKPLKGMTAMEKLIWNGLAKAVESHIATSGNWHQLADQLETTQNSHENLQKNLKDVIPLYRVFEPVKYELMRQY